MGINWLIVIVGLVVLVPPAAVLGAVGGYLLSQRRPARVQPFDIERVAAEDAPLVVQREIDRGARLVGTDSPQSGILTLHFVWVK